MPKLRVYHLARELNRDNAEIIRELQHMGVPVTSHSNTVEDRLADQLRKKLGVFVPQGAQAEVHAAEAAFVEAVEAEAPEPAVEIQPVVPVAKPEAPRVEVRTEPKIEPKVEPPK